MNKTFLIVTILLIIVQATSARSPFPVIKATSTQIKILDGDDLREGGLAPELKPDVYPYHKTNKPKRIVYYTDIDSIAFIVKPGDTYDFAVLLNNKDTCFQRIAFENPGKVKYTRPSTKIPLGNDTIPFILGNNNAIHLKGKINNSDLLDLIFDTGANMGVLSEEGKKKGASLSKDNKNKFEFGGITVGNSPAIFVDYHGGLKADGVIGYNVFEDKIVEINYDKNIMVIHASADGIGKAYTPVDMHWKGENLFVDGELNIKGVKHKGLFLFDTGSKWALSLTKGFSSLNQLYDAMEKVGTRRGKGVNGKSIKSKTVLLPELIIGNLTLANVPIDIELPAEGDGLAFNILGNDVLKRFNVILDYSNGIIYLQKNHLINAPYNTSFDEKWIYTGLGVLLAVIIAGLIFYKRKKANRLAI